MKTKELLRHQNKIKIKFRVYNLDEFHFDLRTRASPLLQIAPLPFSPKSECPKSIQSSKLKPSAQKIRNRKFKVAWLCRFSTLCTGRGKLHGQWHGRAVQQQSDSLALTRHGQGTHGTANGTAVPSHKSAPFSLFSRISASSLTQSAPNSI